MYITRGECYPVPEGLCGKEKNIVVIDNCNLHIFQSNINFVISASLPFCKPVKIKKYAKFDPNIPCGSRVMSIFTN